jgi:hypothetical protein
MLEVVAMTLGNFAVDGLLDPGDLVDELVAILLHHVEGKTIFGVDNPNEQEAVALDLIEGDVQDVLVIQSVIRNGHSSCRIGRGKLPRRVNCYHIEEPSTKILLALSKKIEIELGHIYR